MAKKILVVDDNPDAITIAKVTLEAKGYQVTGVENGQAALDAIEADPPDLVLLDVMMPEMSGMDVLERLKSNPKTSLLPVIMLTAKTQDDDVLDGYRYGADYYITKPFTTRQLMYGIELVLGEGGGEEGGGDDQEGGGVE